MKKITYSIISLLLLLTYSCVDEDKDIFDLPASERMNKAIRDSRAALVAAENGWLVDYYPEANQKLGGFAMICKFHENGTVDVVCDVATNVAERVAITSEYDVLAEQGPVLSFNTYNEVMHYFSEPKSSSDIDGHLGDYEFVIQEITADKIVMKGKKHGNRAVFRKLASDVDHTTYLKEVEDTYYASSSYGTFRFIVNGTQAGEASVDERTFNLGFSVDGQDYTAKLPYAFTDKGIRLYEPLEFDGVVFENFVWDETNGKFVCTDENVNVAFEGFFPEGYELKYSDFLGKWNLSCYATSASRLDNFEVTLTRKKNNATFNLVGDIFPGPVEILFDSTKGTISFLGGKVIFEHDNGDVTKALAYSRNSGYLSTSLTYGLNGIWNKDKENISIAFVDNGKWVTRVADGIYLRRFDSAGGTVSHTYPYGYRFSTITLTKIND